MSTERPSRLRCHLAPLWASVPAISGIAVFGLLGAASRRIPALTSFDLDAEWALPATFAALLLVSAGAALIALANTIRFGWAAAVVGVFALAAAVDEMVQAHERLSALLGIHWQQLYAPAFLAAGIAGVLLIIALREHRAAQLMLVGGCAAWVISQALDRIQWNGDVAVSGYGKLMVAEEVLEMTGSALVLFAALRVRMRSPTEALEASGSERTANRY